MDQGNVNLPDGALPEGFGKLCMRKIIFCDQENAGSLFVQAMDDAGAQRIRRLRKGLAASQ